LVIIRFEKTCQEKNLKILLNILFIFLYTKAVLGQHPIKKFSVFGRDNFYPKLPAAAEGEFSDEA